MKLAGAHRMTIWYSCVASIFGHLITKKKPEEDDKIEDLVNPHSVSVAFLCGHQRCWSCQIWQAAQRSRVASLLAAPWGRHA